jgi:hypothetical protein
MKKSAFKTIAEVLTFGNSAEFPTDSLDSRRLSLDEVKSIVKEEFGKAKDAADVKAKEAEKGWGDVELEKEVNWMKALQIKEFFDKDLE